MITLMSKMSLCPKEPLWLAKHNGAVVSLPANARPVEHMTIDTLHDENVRYTYTSFGIIMNL